MRLRSVLLAVLLSLAPLAITAPASAEWGTATIQGTVTNAVTGAPVSGVTVQLVLDGSSTFETTDANGHYESTGRDAGAYAIGFADYSGQYLGEWNDNKPDQSSADLVTVPDPGTTTVDAALSPLPRISGRVTDSTGRPVAGLCPGFLYGDPAAQNLGGGPCTDADGQYSFGVAQPGTYRVQFRDPSGSYASQWYAQASLLSKATPLTVDAHDVTGVNAVLQPGSALTTALRAPDGHLLHGCVSAYDVEGQLAESACTTYDDSEGPATPVTLHGLPAGSYRLGSQSFDRHYLPRYSGGALSLDKAKSVSVAVGQTRTAADLVLPVGASMTAHIVDAVTGAPLRFVCATTTTVDARQGGAADGAPGQACSNEAGDLEILGMEAGSYPVQLSEAYGGTYSAFFLPHAPDARTATQYKVKLGQRVSLGTISMTQGGTATATVVDSHGAPVDYACLIALSARTAEPIGNAGCSYGSDPAQLTGLPTGDVYLYAFDVAGGSAPTYFPSARTLKAATTVHVTEGQATNGLRLVLAAG